MAVVFCCDFTCRRLDALQARSCNMKAARLGIVKVDVCKEVVGQVNSAQNEGTAWELKILSEIDDFSVLS